MRSLNHLENFPAGIPLVADEIVEFHAARLLLLIRLCGNKDKSLKLYKIDSLTKLAKLDFFIRYPEFFRRVALYLKKDVTEHKGGVESRMIRYYYGPWDQRYYQVLPFLESRSLLRIEKSGNAYNFILTEQGESITQALIVDTDYLDLVKNISDVQKVLSKFNGSRLKELVYKLFEEEVANKKLGETIN